MSYFKVEIDSNLMTSTGAIEYLMKLKVIKSFIEITESQYIK